MPDDLRHSVRRKLQRISRAALVTIPLLWPLTAQGQATQPGSEKKPNVSSVSAPSDSTTAKAPTPPLPIHVTVISPDKSAEQLQTETKNREREIDIQAQIGNFTGRLVWVGVLQVLAAILSLIFTFIATSAAKKSVDVSANALAITLQKERPYIDMSHEPPGLRFDVFESSNSEDPANKNVVRVAIATKNHGNTPGTITARLIQLVFFDGPLPKAPAYDDAAVEVVRIPLMKDEIVRDTFSWRMETAAIQRSRIEETAHLYVIGFVDYMDLFGGRYRCGYARRWDPHAAHRHLIYEETNGIIVPLTDANTNNLPFVTEGAYTYDRPRKPGEGNDWE